MINEKPKQCKSKGCRNPVLDGKYCENCKKRRTETKNKILAGAGGAAIIGGGIAIKKGALKQVSKFAVEVLRIIFKK